MKIKSQYDKFAGQDALRQYLEVNVFTRSIVKLSTGLFFLTILSLLFVQWTPAISGTGQLVAFDPSDRIQQLESPINGKIEQWYALEGEQLEKGQLIVRISDVDSGRLQRLTNQLENIKARVVALQKQEHRQKLHVKRMNQLFRSGIESKRAAELAEIDLYKVEAEKNKVQSDQEMLFSTIARQSAQEIRAQQAGVLLKVFIPAESEIVKTGEVLAQIAPSDVKVAAEVFIAGKDLPLLRLGQKTRVMFEGWPAVQIVGWPSVAVGTFPGEIKVINQGTTTGGTFRLIITQPLDADTAWPDNGVGMGSKVQAWVQMRTVPLWWELWRRFSGVPPRV